MNNFEKSIVVNRVSYSFGNNGLPKEILLPAEFDKVNLLVGTPKWDIRDENNQVLEVKFTDDSIMEIIEKSDYTTVNFHSLQVTLDQKLQMNIRYSLYKDGTVFAEPFLFGTMCNPIKLSKMALVMELNMSEFAKVRFAMPYRPKEVDGKLIQTSAPERELVPGDNRIIDNGIFPQIGLYCCSNKNLALYAEIFMESDGSAAGKNADTESSVIWENGNPILT